MAKGTHRSPVGILHPITFVDLMRPHVSRQRARWLWMRLNKGAAVDDRRAATAFRQATRLNANQMREIAGQEERAA